MKEAFENAIKFEVEGFDFYKKIAGEIKQPLAKRLFESLASQEKEHIERIKKIYDSLENNKEINDLLEAGSTPIEEELKMLFQEMEEEKRKATLDHEEGYKVAMEMEEKGYNMYKRFAQEAKDPKEKIFFETLMKEESEHLESLRNVYSYLTDTVNWYSVDESKVWNWMV